jgi:hypothetical protein
MTLVVGGIGGHLLAPLGRRSTGTLFDVAQPGYLFTGPDGVLWIFTSYGAAAYDPMSTEAAWMVQDVAILNGENNFTLYNQAAPTAYGSVIPIATNTLFGSLGSGEYVFNIDAYSSAMDPTRTITITNQAPALVDTTRDIVEAFEHHGETPREARPRG